ncbi:hypothetical protein CBE89_10495 [Corynebacterium striatum]|uniref:Uncharacterized protein n=1 Tax=Corynebacterium striatum TaxID=43770 RepID=A0A2Z2J9E7_CORST|nr:hypothetical protein CBE89_10495 [Corynebacterium striatum]
MFTTEITSITAESTPHFPHTVDTVIIPMNSTNAFNQHSIATVALALRFQFKLQGTKVTFEWFYPHLFPVII